MIRALVVEDEPLASEQLTRFLTATGQVEVIGAARDVQGGMDLCTGLQADVVFLDVQLPAPGGLTLGAELAKAPQPPLCVFIGASAQHAVAAFDLHAADYLLKPLRSARVRRAVEYLDQRLREREAAHPAGDAAADRLPVRLRERDMARLLARGEVVAVLRKGRRIWIHTRDAEYPSYQAVSALEEWLGGSPFLRTARDAIVNMDQVAEITHFGDRLYQLQLRDRGKTVVKVSRSAASILAGMLRALPAGCDHSSGERSIHRAFRPPESR